MGFLGPDGAVTTTNKCLPGLLEQADNSIGIVVYDARDKSDRVLAQRSELNCWDELIWDCAGASSERPAYSRELPEKTARTCGGSSHALNGIQDTYEQMVIVKGDRLQCDLAAVDILLGGVPKDGVEPSGVAQTSTP